MAVFNVDRIMRFILCLFFALYPFYTVIRLFNLPLSLLLYLFLLILVFFKILLNKKIFFSKTFFSGIIFLIIYVLLNDFVHGRPNIRSLLPLIWSFFPFLLVNLIDNKKYFFKLIEILFLSSSFLSFLVILKFYNFIDIDFIKIHTHKSGLVRFLGIGSDPNPNGFAVQVFLALLFSFLLIKKEKSFKRIIYIIFRFFLFFILILSESRALLFGFLLSIILIFLFNINRSKMINLLKILGITLLFVITFLLINPNKLITKRLVSSEFSNRLKRWESSIDIFVSNPLIGIGATNVKKVIGEKKYIEEKNVHNFYLDLLASTGIVGFLSFLIFLIDICLLLYNFKFINRHNYIYVIFFLTFLLFNVTHSMFLVNSFWVYLALLESNYKISEA